MSSMLEQLVRLPGLQIEIATVCPGLRKLRFEENGVTYFVIGQPRKPGMFFRCRKRDLDACVEIVRERSPDLIHIHGTERFYGLMAARNLISVPAVISVQGLLKPYMPVFFGALSARESWRSNRFIELVSGRGLFWLYLGYLQGAQREQEILAGAKSFMGRTNWDRAHVESANLAASYYHVGELLRQPFSACSWDVSRCDRHTVIFTNAGSPCRGTEVLLRAMLVIRREFPDVKVRLAGNVGMRKGYDHFLRRMTAESGLSEAVEFLGYLDASAMARELCRAHVFAIPSYLENSPNSLCEAMQVGLPCVASYVGGIPTLVEQGRTGLLFPPGDAPLLANAIIRIFRSDDLAARLGAAARAEATERHVPEHVLSQLLNTYKTVIAHEKERHYDAPVACL